MIKRTRIASMKGKGAGEGGERLEYATLRRDPAMDKYFKMLSFGVPSSGVAQKMSQDEMPPEKVAIFAAGPDGSNASSFAGAERYLPIYACELWCVYCTLPLTFFVLCLK